MTTIEMLDTLAEYQAQRDALDLAKQDAIASVLTPEIKAQLAAIDAEFADKSEAVDANIATLTNDIKADVLAAGATVKGAHMMAVWSKPRVSWDTAKLDGLMIVIPQLKDARKVGEPSVSIRKVG